MTASLHLFMRDLLDSNSTHTATSHDSSDSSSTNSSSSSNSLSLVVDNARMHHVHPKPIAGTKKTSQHKRLRSKDFELDVSDHSKKDSRWTSQEEQQQRRGFNSLDVSDHSKKESRWSCTSDKEVQGAQQEMITAPTSSPSSPPSTWSLMKSLDVSDHSRRESRWDSLSSVPLYHPHHDGAGPGQQEPHHHHHHHHRSKSSFSSHSLSPVKNKKDKHDRDLTQWKEKRRNSYDNDGLFSVMKSTSLLLEHQHHHHSLASRSHRFPPRTIGGGGGEQNHQSSVSNREDALKHVIHALDIVEQGRQIGA